MPDLSHVMSVDYQLTAEQYDRILRLTLLMGLDPDRDLKEVAQRVIRESLDLRIENCLAEYGV